MRWLSKLPLTAELLPSPLIEVTELSNTYARRRTIAMPEARAQQIAMVSAELGVSAEIFIQSAITAALVSAMEHDDTLALALARVAGASWDELAAIAKLRADRNAKACLAHPADEN
jgi:hypothetical protein